MAKVIVSGSFIAKTCMLAAVCVFVIIARGRSLLAGIPSLAQSAPGAFIRYPVDEEEIAHLNRERPHVVDLLTQGEALALGGDVTRALAFFSQAADEDSHSGLVLRRKCEALTALGKRSEAMETCREALLFSPIALNRRAFVRAGLAGPEPLSASDLAQALQTAGIERRQRPDERWGYEALCEIAERIGDNAMLEYCAQGLLRVAPNDPTTRRVLAELSPGWGVGAGWLAIVSVTLGTLAHALWRLARRPHGRARAAAAITVVALSGVFYVRAARADEPPAAGAPAPPAAAPSHQLAAQPPPPPPPKRNSDDLARIWTVNEDAPESSIPDQAARNRDPIEFGYWLQDLTARALRASQRGDHAAAIKFFRALARAVPERAVPFRKLCAEYEAVDDRNSAIFTCSLALTREGAVLDDYTSFVHVVLNKGGTLDGKEMEALTEAIKHVRESGNEDAARLLECDVAVRRRDEATLKSCTEQLSASAPNSPKTLTYQWALAMVQGRYDEARKIIELAKASSMKPEGLQAMEQETLRTQSGRTRSLLLAGAAFALLAGAIAIWLAMRRRSILPEPTPQES